MSTATYRDYIAWLCRGVRALSSSPGDGFVGVLFGLLPDSLAEGMSQAYKAALMTLSGQPEDALPRLARERVLPRYSGETATQHQSRLQGAWDAYQYAGHESAIISQLQLAGFGVDGGSGEAYIGVEVWPLIGFTVYFPYGSHPVTEGAPVWGGFHWGDGTKYGPITEPAGALATIRAIIRKWKPIDRTCTAISFQLSDGSTVEIGP